MATYDTGVSWLAPVAVAVPIIVACLLLVIGRLVPRGVVDAIALAAATGVLCIAAVILWRTGHGRVVTWSGGWTPRHGFSVGIVLVSDPVGAGLALLAAALAVAALLYGVRYFESVHAQYHALVLLFLAGMQGFSLSADLFDMFVFFELMGAAAYALTGFKIEDLSALQGAVNFGILNSIGAYGALLGIGLLYARTGNLGLPQLGDRLAGHAADPLVVAAFVLVLTGFLVKGAMAPFHFWLADAHAVAPTPICVLFSGVMVPLGLYAAFRVYWIVFSGVLALGDVRRAFVALGVVTAALGALMCVSQRHVKRLLAYSTIAHVGLFLFALGCLTQLGTAGALLYVGGHAGVKGALFLLAGIMLNRYDSVDELDLYGRGRAERLTPALFLVGGLALAGLPPFGTGLGKATSEQAGVAAGYPWAPWLFVAVSALTGAAVLRVTARVYRGLGPHPAAGESSDRTTGRGEERETRLARVPATMLAAILALLAGSLAIGVLPEVRSWAGRAAAQFVDPTGYRRQALAGGFAPTPPHPTPQWTAEGVALDLLSPALAVAVAGLALYGRRLVASLPRARAAVGTGVTALHRVHSGHIGDYVAWLLLGMAVLAGFVLLPAR